jgi:hypothetical protein
MRPIFAQIEAIVHMPHGCSVVVDFVAALPDHPAVAHDDAADRVLAGLILGLAREGDRAVHPVFVVVGPAHPLEKGLGPRCSIRGTVT